MSSTSAAGSIATDVLNRSDLSRMRLFHRFVACAAALTVITTPFMPGDPVGLEVYFVGGTALALSNAALLYYVKTEQRYQSPVVVALWTVACTSALTAIYYGGPFSVSMIVPAMGLIFISLDRARNFSFVAPTILIGGSLALALLFISGTLADHTVMRNPAIGRAQLLGCEVMAVALLIGAWWLANLSRSSTAHALAELEDAMRVIADQAQVLADANVDVARARAFNEGRWTGQTMGEWQLGLVLGRGAMGEVYEAHDGAGRSAAVKLLDARSAESPARVERFLQEMRVSARLESPHIVKVLSLSPPDARVPYFAMERLHGEDLATRLRTVHRLPLDELGVLIDHVAHALDCARKAGVVHRDLKPHNLILHAGSTWKVIDFGISKLLDGDGSLTGDALIGTPQYMAPEQAAGDEVTPLADIYALGAIAYRCVTGRSPFNGKEAIEIIYQVIHAPPNRPSLLADVPKGIDDVVARAMAKQPQHRFPTARAFSEAFVAVMQGRPLELAVPPGAWLG